MRPASGRKQMESCRDCGMPRVQLLPLLLILPVWLMSGCSEPVQRMQLSDHQAELRASMQALLGQALATGEESIDAYLQLESYVAGTESGDWLPEQLEEHSSQINASFQSLQDQLDRTLGASDAVASMLAAEARAQQDLARQFSSPEDRSVATNVLGNAMQATAYAVETLGDSVRHYETIVSLLQDSDGIATPRLTADINRMLQSVFRVNSEIHQNVSEGISVIETL